MSNPYVTDQQDPLIKEALDQLTLLETCDLGEEKKKEITNWQHKSNAHKIAWEKANSLWNLFGQIGFMPAVQTTPMSAKGFGRAFNNYLSPTSVAALSISLMITAFYGFFFTNQSVKEYKSTWGEQRTISLSDGSTTSLNFSTEVSVNMTEDKRIINLKKGQAAFIVEKDSERPFIVISGNTTVRAIGTAFDVRMLNDHETTISVTEGYVEVTSTLGSIPVQLSAHETITARYGKLNFPRRIEHLRANSWERGLLVFHHTPLEEVLNELNRYTEYDIQFLLGEKETTQVTGTFQINRIHEGLQSLIQAHDLHADVSPDGTRIITHHQMK